MDSKAVADLLPGEVVAIDGKTVRRSHDNRAGKQPIHLERLGLVANTLTLGQVKTEESKSPPYPGCWSCWSCMGA